MKRALKSVVPNFVHMLIIALIGNMVGDWLIGNPGVGPAHAATLTIQSVPSASLAAPPAHAPRAKGTSPLAVPGVAAGTGFTYQGRLLDKGIPADGQYDSAFTLYNVLFGGIPVARGAPAPQFISLAAGNPGGPARRAQNLHRARQIPGCWAERPSYRQHPGMTTVRGH